jgi:hypothetical protein
MGTIIDVHVPDNITELLKNSSVSPDFSIMTDGMMSDPHTANLVHMIGSSTERDLEGDTMSIHALNDMTKAPKNLTIWLNHDYTLPDSIFGSIVGTPRIVHQDGIADLHLSVDVEMDNPAAAKVKQYIDNGRRLGCSIGCMVTKFEVPDDEQDAQWYQNPIIIHGVRVVEYSVVGVPANQRSWVENAIRGVFTRTLHPQLAPAMKSLWPRAYREIIDTRTKTSESAKYFQDQPERKSSGRRLDWHPDKNIFVLSNRKGLERSMGKEELKNYLAGNSVVDAPTLTITPIGVDSTTSLYPLVDNTKTYVITTDTSAETALSSNTIVEKIEPTVKELTPDVIRTACGSTSLALDMNSSWDKGSAHGRILEWAGGKDSFSKAKMKQVHFRYDGSGDNITDYHLPFADIKDGNPVAIWHAIVAVAGALGGARSGLTHEGDEGSIRSKVAHYYKKAGKPVPWQSDGEKSMDKLEVQKQAKDSIVFAINKDGTPGLVLDEGGNHVAFTGTHTHIHGFHTHTDKSITDPGEVVPLGGQVHLHEHSHNGDSTHEHEHSEDTIAAYKPPVPMRSSDNDGDNAGDIDMDGAPDLDAGGGQRHLSLDDEHIQSQLDVYNSFGKLLGLPEVALEKIKSEYPAVPAMDIPPSPATGEGLPEHVRKAMRFIHARTYAMTGGKVCSGFGSDGEHLTRPGQAPNGSNPVPVHPSHAKSIQAIHDHAHAMSGADDNDADDMKRALAIDMVKEMAGYGGPGNAGGSAGPAGFPEHVQKAVQGIHAYTYSMTGGKVCKGVGTDGSHLVSPEQAPDGSHPVPMHPDHAGHVQKCHDAVHTLTNGMSCGMGSQTHQHYNETNFQEARQELMDAEGQITPNSGDARLRSFTEGVDRMTKALENIDVKALRKEVDMLKKEFSIARKGIQEIYQEAATAASTVAALKNMPLGNPLKQNRTIVSTDSTTTHQELATLASGNMETLDGLLAMTTLETYKMPGGTSISYRKWTNGLGGSVGKGLRPDLTSNQIALMSFDDIEAYRAGLASKVPMVDDPADSLFE